jgi:hypothetical protein
MMMMIYLPDEVDETVPVPIPGKTMTNFRDEDEEVLNLSVGTIISLIFQYTWLDQLWAAESG